MGATSADTQREIAALRQDVASALEELDARARRAVDVVSRVRSIGQSPAALAGIAVLGLAAGGVVAYRVVSGARERRRAGARAANAARDIEARLGRLGESIPIGALLGGRYPADDGARAEDAGRSEPSMLKRVLWAALAATMMAGAGLVARRLSAALWKAAMNEEPPTAKV